MVLLLSVWLFYLNLKDFALLERICIFSLPRLDTNISSGNIEELVVNFTPIDGNKKLNSFFFFFGITLDTFEHSKWFSQNSIISLIWHIIYFSIILVCTTYCITITITTLFLIILWWWWLCCWWWWWLWSRQEVDYHIWMCSYPIPHNVFLPPFQFTWMHTLHPTFFCLLKGAYIGRHDNNRLSKAPSTSHTSHYLTRTVQANACEGDFPMMVIKVKTRSGLPDMDVFIPP